MGWSGDLEGTSDGVFFFTGQGRPRGAVGREFPAYVIRGPRAIQVYSRPDGVATRVFLLFSATMVELRKRKAPAPPPVVKKSKSTPPKPDNANSTSQTDAPKVPQVDDVLDLENFGGEIETNDGSKTSLKKLVESSTAGVVLFTYPKASTPGCMYPHLLIRPGCNVRLTLLHRHQASLLVS